MDDELLADIALILMNEAVYGGAALGPLGREALKRTMLKVDVTVMSSRSLYTQDVIDLRLRELLCLPPAA